MSSPDFSTKAGTITGVVLTMLLHISVQQMAETAVIAGVGAASSFAVSYLLQLLSRKR